MNAMMFFLSGMAFATFLLAGLFFFKFWRASGDRFFRFLSIAFWAFALERFVNLVSFVLWPDLDVGTTARPWLYFIRLLGFAYIVVLVIQKNRSVKN